MVSHELPGALVIVTKSAVMNMLATPSISNSSLTKASSVSAPRTKVDGPPTGTPTANFIAFGFGVGAGCTGIGN